MVLLLIAGVVIAGAIIDRAAASNDMPLEQHEQHQHVTNILFVALLFVGGLALLASLGFGG